MTTTQRSARDLVAAITTATGDGEYDAAVRAATWGIASFPDAAVFPRLRGVARTALAAHEEAKADLNAALAVDPLDHEALVTLSRLEEADGDLYTAAEYLLTAWEHDPANSDLRSDLTHRLARLYGSEGYLQYTRPALAALYVRNSYPERAAREYAAALAEQPTRVDLRLASVLARWRLGVLPETVSGCLLLLQEQPRLARARWALADALARQGKGEEAREHARHAALLDPDGAIARALIAGNPDATIVDPDEMVRIPLDIAPAAPRVAKPDPSEMPAAVPVVPSPSAPLFAAPAPDAETQRDAFALTDSPVIENETAPAPLPAPALEDEALVAPFVEEPRDDTLTTPLPWEIAFGATRDAAEADHMAASEADTIEIAPIPTAESDEAARVPEDSELPHVAASESLRGAIPIDTVAPDAVPPEPGDEPEPVLVVAATDGEILVTQPGGEPLLDATDALPQPPDVSGGWEIAGQDRASDAPVVPDEADGLAPSAFAAPQSEPLSLSASPAAVASPAEAPIAPPEPDTRMGAPEGGPPDDVWARMQTRLAAEDVAGAVAIGRAALATAGKEPAQVRPLLPAMRALVEAAPGRPDAHRLLGDTYRRLGQMTQAQGQYQQALLVRVAGKR